MPTLEIGEFKGVELDDSFNALTPIQQQETVNRVHQQLKAGKTTGGSLDETVTEETEVEETQTPSSITKPVTQQQPQQQEPQEQPPLTMDDLDTDKEWIEDAAAIYENEEGESWKGSNVKLAEWLKNRHSEIGWDVTSIGSLALRSDDFDDKTKAAWVRSMDKYDDTDADTMSFFRALKNLGQDPTTWPSLLAGFGTGTIAKIGGTKAAGIAAKFQMKDQLKKSLIKRGLSKEAAEEAATKGATEGLKKEVLSSARKEAAKAVGKNQGIAQAIGGTAYGGADNLSRQQADINLERTEEEEIGIGEFLAHAAGTGLVGGLLGRYIPTRLEALGRKRALRKQEALDQAIENATPTQVKHTTATIDTMIPESKTGSLARQAQRDLELEGVIDIDVMGPRVATKAEREAVDIPKRPSDKKWKEMDEVEQLVFQQNRTRAKEKFKNLSDEELIETFKQSSIELKRTGPNTFQGRKIADTTRPASIKTPEGRTKFQKWIGEFKKGFWDDSGLGDKFKQLRTRLDTAPAVMERNIMQQFDQLTKSINKELEGGIDAATPELYKVMDKAFRGDVDAIAQVQSEVGEETVNALGNMRKQIQYLQDQLLKSGVIKENSDLFFTIKNSMDSTTGKPDLHVVRQYAVFDNPNYKKEFDARPDALEIKRKVEDFFVDTLRQQYKDYDDIYLKMEKINPNTGNLSGRNVLNAAEHQLLKDFEEGEIANRINRLLTLNDEDDIANVFSKWKAIGGRNPTKILAPREDIPSEIRLLMGEYKNPFTNYANTAMKLFQTAETYNYEKELAKLIDDGEIINAGRRSVGDRSKELKSRIPDVTGVQNPLDPTAATSPYKQPLEGLFATSEVAKAIKQGNEIDTSGIPKVIQQYLLLQGHTRAAKTVWSPTAIARNFLGAGWMSMGAGYFRPGAIKGMAEVARGLSSLSNRELQDEIERGIALGYIQSGTDLGAFRGALQDAGEEAFWKLNSPLYKSKNSIMDKAKRLNTKAVKFYQSMDDMWKQFAFINERRNYEQVLRDRGIEPDEVVREFMGGSGNSIKITALDDFAAQQVNNHMQNYGGVPQFVRAARLLPAADFLAFTTEIIRTQKNIIKSAFRDMREGRELMKKGIKAVGADKKETGLLQGQAQAKAGERRLGSIIAAQSAAPALATTSALVTGIDQKEEGMPYTIRQGMAKFDPDFDQGASYIYLGKPENGKGKKINIDYINPWAKTQLPIRAAMDALNKGAYVDGVVDDAFNTAVLRPLADTFGASMLAEAAWNIYKNVDEYGRPIFGETDTGLQKVGKGLETVWEAFEPGFVKTAKDMATSMNLEGKDYGVRKGKTGTRLYINDELAGLTGIKPKYYDINKSLRFQANDIKRNMADAGKIFSNALQQMQPQTEEEIVGAYKEALEKQYAQATKMFDLITAAKSTGMKDSDIIKAITRGGLFPKGADKRIITNMVKRGVYIPEPPVTADAFKYGVLIERETDQKPPIMESLNKLQEVYSTYAGEVTGER